MMSMIVNVNNLSELRIFAKKLSRHIKGGEILALSGKLGAGKTTFVKMLLRELGVKNKISSPTFVLMLPYQHAKRSYYHLDLYRTKNSQEIKTLGVFESWGKKENIFLIEWADKIKSHLPKKTISLNFQTIAGSNRSYRKITIKNAPKNFEI